MSDIEKIALQKVYAELDKMITRLRKDIRHLVPPSHSTVSQLRAILPEGYENSFTKDKR